MSSYHWQSNHKRSGVDDLVLLSQVCRVYCTVIEGHLREYCAQYIVIHSDIELSIVMEVVYSSGNSDTEQSDEYCILYST